jgi:DNA-binding FadR family transcriptional regulator
LTRIPKRAQQVAEQIEREILDQQLPTGHRLGTEPELIAQYGVSRAVLREAIRLLERHQLAETRRGNLGGLFVAQPAEDAISRVLCAYLESIGLELGELFEARRLLEPALVRYAAIRAGRRGAETLEAILMERPEPGSPSENTDLFDRYFARLGEVARSPALALFVRAAHQAAGHVASGRQFSKQAGIDEYRTVWKSQLGVTKAIGERDVELAEKRVQRLLNHEEREWRARPPRRRRRAAGGLKGGDTLAREISEYIRHEGLEPGDWLGSEPDLLEHYGVSRAVLREAVRMLEQHRIAEMRRGLDGGLIVAKPDPASVIRAASVYLAHLGLATEPIKEARMLLEPAGAALAAERASESELSELAGEHVGVLTLEGTEAADAARGLHEHIVDLSGNRALALFTRVIIAAAWGLDRPVLPALPADALDAIRVSDTRIVGALHDRDAERARRAMEHHLEITFEWWAALYSR